MLCLDGQFKVIQKPDFLLFITQNLPNFGVFTDRRHTVSLETKFPKRTTISLKVDKTLLKNFPYFLIFFTRIGTYPLPNSHKPLKNPKIDFRWALYRSCDGTGMRRNGKHKLQQIFFYCLKNAV